ncbi:MAG: lipocalin-like domain-containing protein [Bacteroidaceae bacterium]|nr:lipocalin-like domain-containing protein [Bacteroidaceae bacterium]
MKKLILYILILCPLFCFIGCDKLETNGDFAGMWQLTEWKNLADGQIVADKHDGIYYSVQLDLMAFNGKDQYLARFRRTSDSLFIGTVYHGPKDDIVGYDELAKYGVPADGKFAIERLTKQALILRTDDVRLTFRKY